MEGINVFDFDIDEQYLEKLHLDPKKQPTGEQKIAMLKGGKIIVSASAGSGKTSTMVNRIVLMVATGRSLKEMIILVYNEAAASELKEKLHSKLRECVKLEQDKNYKEKFEQALDDLPLCNIGTIHSFCKRLIGENFEQLELSPNFEVLDENEHEVYKNRAIENVFAKYAEDGDADFNVLAQMFSTKRNEEEFTKIVKKLHGIIEVYPDKNVIFDMLERCYDSYDDSEFCKIIVDYYHKYFGNATEIMQKKLEKMEKTKMAVCVTFAQTSHDFCENMAKATTLEEMAAESVSGLKIDKRDAAYKQQFKCDGGEDIKPIANGLVDEIREYNKKFIEINDIVKDLYLNKEKYEAGHIQNGRFARKLVEIALKVDEELKESKKKDNVLSFEDLLQKAVELLDKDASLSAMSDIVYVDEYQDVNPTQEYIIDKLIRDECFMVGDVKQSIYGFRLADPDLFLERYKKYGKKALKFNRNFRSTRQILQFVNDVFGAIMTNESAGIDYKNDAAFDLSDAKEGEAEVTLQLFAPVSEEKDIERGLYDIQHHRQANAAAHAADAEGEYIAKKILYHLEHTKTVDDQTKEQRNIEYRDIAILFRDRSKNPKRIIAALRKYGIPIDDSGFTKAEEDADAPERDLVNMLRVIDNPYQDMPLAGYMLSYFGGFDENELARIAERDGAYLYDKVLSYINSYDDANNAHHEEDLLANKLKAMIAEIDNYRVKASFKSVGELIAGIISNTSYYAYMMREGEAKVNALKEFASRAKKEEGSLGKFLDDYVEKKAGKSANGGGNKVKVSTFHAYKGLEIPIVFVADLAKGFNFDTKSVIRLNNKGLIGMPSYDFAKHTRVDSLSSKAVTLRNRETLVKEEMRLLYVALTRAKQVMYLTASLNTKNKNKEENFGKVPTLGNITCNLDFLADAACYGVAIRRNPTIFEWEDSDRSEEANTLNRSQKIVELLKEAQSTKYAHEDATRLNMKYSVSALDGAYGESGVALNEEATSEGVLYHKIMQNINLHTSGIDEVNAELDSMVSYGILTAEERKEVDAGIIARCLASDIMQLARKADLNKKCYREKPFTMLKPANSLGVERLEFESSDKVLVQGVIDLLIDGDELIIVDFKFSGSSDEKIREKFKKQLYLYKEAVESAFSRKVSRVVLYSFKTGHPVEC